MSACDEKQTMLTQRANSLVGKLTEGMQQRGFFEKLIGGGAPDQAPAPAGAPPAVGTPVTTT